MTPEEILPDELLERLRGRAAGYDQNNQFFHEDLEDLAAAGYLKLFAPEADGGFGSGSNRWLRCSNVSPRLPPRPQRWR